MVFGARDDFDKIVFPRIMIVFLVLPFFGMNPVYWLAFAFVVHHWTVSAVAVAIAACWVNAAFGALGLCLSTILSSRHFRQSLFTNFGRLQPIPPMLRAALIPRSLMAELLAHNMGSSLLLFRCFPPGGSLTYLYFWECVGDGKIPAGTGVAFVGAEGIRVAIIRDSLSDSPDAWERFVFLHELAHISSIGAKQHALVWRFFLTSVNWLLFGMTLCWSWASPWVYAPFALWCSWNLWILFHYDDWLETYADRVAYDHLPDDESRQKVLKDFERRATSNRQWKLRYKALCAGPRRNLISPMGDGTIYDPSLLPFFLASCFSLWVGFNSPWPATWTLTAFIMLVVAVQATAAIAQLFAIACSKDIIARLMRRSVFSDETS